MKLNLFPLGIVAFPNKSIPLHIFEDRYKRMINDCIDNGNEFGIIYQNIKGIAEFGCTVSVTKLLKRYPDGRMDILSKGNRIFKLDSKKIVNDIVVGKITVLPKFNPLSSEVFDPLLEKYLKLLITLLSLSVSISISIFLFVLMSLPSFQIPAARCIIPIL